MNDDDSAKKRSLDLEVDTSTVPEVAKCLKAFGILLTAVDNTDNPLHGAVVEHNGRFRIWSGNIGAHQTGKSSLDYRLRETPYIKTRILRLLNDLNGLLNEATAIITGVRQAAEIAIPDEEGSSDSESDSESDDTQHPNPTEIQQIFTEILEIINCLYRLSMSVRNPTGTQRYIKSAHIDTSFYEPYDVEHVRQLFPQAKEYLIERLGKAVSKRRQYLKYRETHAAKLAQHLDERDTTTGLSETTASALLIHGVVHEDAKSVISEASGATSVGSVQKARMPSMPQAARNRQPFECPHCRTIECVKDTNSWIKHVYRDLQPYMCTFEKCKTPHEMYEGRRQWFNHELQQHRRSWSCNGHCDRTFASEEALASHIKKPSPGLYSDAQLSTLVEMWVSPMEVHAESLCPLCGQGATGTKQTQRHLGRHFEEIALFALPNNSTESEDDEDDQGSIDVSDRMSLASDDMAYQDVPMVCDVCHMTTLINYHCLTCSNNDYDICEACYDQHTWCLDHTHPLVKRLGRNNLLDKNPYYYLDRLENEIETRNALTEANNELLGTPGEVPEKNEAFMLPSINQLDDDHPSQDFVRRKDELDAYGEDKDGESEDEYYGSAAMAHHTSMPEERREQLYKLGPQKDGLYHCPFSPNCSHKPTGLKYNYDKYLDSHLKPYRCRVNACANVAFSSTASLFHHEREAHGMHGRGENRYTCQYPFCNRSIESNGFLRAWDLQDHMDRVHENHYRESLGVVADERQTSKQIGGDTAQTDHQLKSARSYFDNSWQCHSCGWTNNVQLSPNYCSNCPHKRCSACVIFHNGKEEKGARSNENQASEKVAETDGDEHVAPKATFVLSTTRPIFVLQEASEPLEFPPSGTSDIGWEEWDSLVASNIPSLVEESSDRGEPPHNSLQSVVPPSPSTKPAPSETDLGDNSVYRINATGRSTYCTYCRRRELRCDGRKPKCSTCSNLGSACVYQDQKAPDRLTRCCAYCRIRLLRCDGRAPSCSTCSTLGHECVYDEANYRLPETPQTLNGSKEMSENPPLKGLEHKRAKNIKRGPVLVNQLANSQRPDLAAEAGEKPSEDAHSGTVGEINPTRADHILEDFSDDGR